MSEVTHFDAAGQARMAGVGGKPEATRVAQAASGARTGAKAGHLVVFISYHGFGHISQAAPVVNELARRHPDLNVTVVTGAPAEQLRTRIHCPFTLVEEPLDFGMVMRNALDVLVDDSLAAYRRFHTNYADRRDAWAERLRGLAPDVVFADVPYLAVDAAAAAGVPAVGMCSLNWADIFQHYFAAKPDAAAIHAEMVAAYNRAEAFLRPTPSMPMPDLANTRVIGPIAQLGRNRRAEIIARLGLSGSERLILVGLGGLQYDFNIRDWPRDPGVRYLVANRVRLIDHPFAVPFDDIGIPFYDMLRSADVFLTKPGYGSFADAVCNGVPVLHVNRSDWPESAYLVEWLHETGRGRTLDSACLHTGGFLAELEALLAQPAPEPLVPSGITDAADFLDNWLA